MVSIRAATLADGAALAQLSAHVFAQTYGAVIPPQLLAEHLQRGYAHAALIDQLLNPAITYFVAEAATGLIGLCKLEQSDPHPALLLKRPLELAKLYLAAHVHGRGIAQRLLVCAEQFAHSQEYDGLWLCVWKENARALAFYQKSGFTPVGSTLIHVEGVAFDDAVMQKRTLL